MDSICTSSWGQGGRRRIGRRLTRRTRVEIGLRVAPASVSEAVSIPAAVKRQRPHEGALVVWWRRGESALQAALALVGARTLAGRRDEASSSRLSSSRPRPFRTRFRSHLPKRNRPKDSHSRALGAIGGGGGNRTRVRERSSGSSTCVADLFESHRALSRTAGRRTASRWFSMPPSRLRQHPATENGAAAVARLALWPASAASHRV